MEEKFNPLAQQTQNPDNLAIILASHIFSGDLESLYQLRVAPLTSPP
jgi:hypothetical protein